MKEIGPEVIEFCKKNLYYVKVQSTYEDRKPIYTAYFPVDITRNRTDIYTKYFVESLTPKTSRIHKISTLGHVKKKIPTFISRLIICQDIMVLTQKLDIPYNLIVPYKQNEEKKQLIEIFDGFSDANLVKLEEEVATLFSKICYGEQIGEVRNGYIRKALSIMVDLVNKKGLTE